MERVNLYNTEHYIDPTAYAAMVKIEKERRFKPVVYICSPFAGDTTTNVERARRYSRFAVTKGVIPIAPHLLFPQFMDDNQPEEREDALFMGIVLLSKCRELWVFGTRRSPGMVKEIERAEQKNIKIRYFNDLCEELSKSGEKVLGEGYNGYTRISRGNI
jgi:hypothetical protein